MKKKILSIMLAGTMALTTAAVGVVGAGAEESEKSIGDFGSLGEYTPTAGVQTNRLMFAMPGAWQNDTTKDPKCDGAAGIYWWAGFDKPDDKAGGHGWPGYKALKVNEEGVTNLFEINVPTYGNGETGNATQIIWDNYIDGGTETDKAKNPFYDAAQQSRDFPGQYYSRGDFAGKLTKSAYEPLFRYIYKTQLAKAGVEVADIDLNSDTFWVDVNKAAAGEDWDKLKADEKTYQIDIVLDEEDLDFSEFGAYAGNFFNEDLVGDEIYPKEDSNSLGISMLFTNMVFVVNFDPNKMIASPVSGKIGFDGDFYFYYGNGKFGAWPTEELLKEHTGITFDENNNPVVPEGGEYKLDEYGMANRVFAAADGTETRLMTAGNIMGDGYLNGKPIIPTVPTTVPDTKATVPTAQTNATSSTKDTASGSTTANNSNNAVATGEFSMIAIVLVILTAGIGVAIFTRKKYRK